MSRTKTCPLCGVLRWNSDGKIVMTEEELDKFELMGFKWRQIVSALRFAQQNGWKE